MKNKIKVLHIANMNKGSGVAVCLMNFLRYIDKSRIAFCFLTESLSENKNYEEDINLLGGSVYKIIKYKKNIIKYIFSLNKLLKNEEFDIVHCHNFVISIFALALAKKNKIKIRAIHSHNASIAPKYKKIFVLIARIFFKLLATHYFACSTDAGKFLFGHKEFQIIHNAIDVERYRFDRNTRNSIRNKLNIYSNTLVIGHVGRFSEQKNHVFLLDVFSHFINARPNSVLLLVGTGEKEQFLRDLSVKLGLSDKIIFYGIADDVFNVYSAMDIFVFPSLFEGLPLVGIEAQCAGLPIIASNTISKEMGITNLVTWFDLNKPPEKWVDVILEQITTKDERQDMSESIISANYAIIIESKKLERKYIELYNQYYIAV
jgi:glycosyltransferase involved in cell wall biosynthesis